MSSALFSRAEGESPGVVAFRVSGLTRRELPGVSLPVSGWAVA